MNILYILTLYSYEKCILAIELPLYHIIITLIEFIIKQERRNDTNLCLFLIIVSQKNDYWFFYIMLQNWYLTRLLG